MKEEKIKRLEKIAEEISELYVFDNSATEQSLLDAEKSIRDAIRSLERS